MAENNNLQNEQFLKFTRSFVLKICKELKIIMLNTRKLINIRTYEFNKQVQNIIDEILQKSMRSITKDLGVSKTITRRVVHENLR